MLKGLCFGLTVMLVNEKGCLMGWFVVYIISLNVEFVFLIFFIIFNLVYGYIWLIVLLKLIFV